MKKYNTKIKRYPDGYFSQTVSNQKIFHDPKDEEYRVINYYDDDTNSDLTVLEKNNKWIGFIQPDGDIIPFRKKRSNFSECESRSDSVNRARAVIFDSIMLNDLDLFISFTLNDNILDARDIPLISKKISRWLSNQVQRRELKYILVPEYHPTSGRLHFHLLCNNVFELVDSGTVLVRGIKFLNGKKNKPIKLSTYHKYYEGLPYEIIYNVKDWKFGFSTAEKMYFHNDDYNIAQRNFRIACYVCKYVTKGNDKIFGKYYWSSHNILRRPEIEYDNLLYDQVKADYEVRVKNVYSLKYNTNFKFDK